MPTFTSTLAQVRAPFARVALLATLSAGAAQAANNFPISAPATKAQTLVAGQTGLVTNTGTLTVSGSDVAVTVTGDGATLTNLGTIKQTGTGRVVRDNTGVQGLTINNGSATNSTAAMTSTGDDVVQMAKTPASVTLNNWGTLTANGGGQVADFNKILSGSNVVNNYATGVLKALEADAVRPGVNGVVNNWGLIASTALTGGGSDGVDAQNNTGVVVNNMAGGVIDGGRHGITGGPADSATPFITTVSNGVGATIKGENGSGLNLDGYNGLQSAVVTNHGTIIGNGVTGDGDGVDVDGLVTLVNTGVIRSLDAVPGKGETLAASEGISVGGGRITNSGLISGEVAAGNGAAKGIGITLVGDDILDKAGNPTGARDGVYVDTVVTNLSGGVIRGQNSSGIVIKGNASGFGVTVANNAGALIQGGGTADAAIQAGLDKVTIDNAGTIDGGSSGRAFAGGGGQVAFNIKGGAAVVLGSIDGGSAKGNQLTVDPGAGHSFSYSSGIANFEKVEIASGTVTLTGKNTYTGVTRIDAGATLVLSGGANRLATAGTLDLEGGTLKLVDMPGANGQAFAVLSLGQDSAIALGGSSLTFDALGNLVAGKTLALTDWLAATSPGYALRFEGDLTHDAAFLALMGETTIDGLAATVHFDGTYTDVTAVPEPANAALLLGGLALLGAVARRRLGVRS